MKLSEVKKALNQVEKVRFQLPDGKLVPKHFHVTEIGKITKHFIDCGGTLRNEEVINFQLWTSVDYHHRLQPKKLSDIITLSEEKLDLNDAEIEVEYQGNTIEKYALNFDGTNFILTSKQTDCLAKDNCGIPLAKPVLKMAELAKSCCDPNSGCC